MPTQAEYRTSYAGWHTSVSRRMDIKTGFWISLMVIQSNPFCTLRSFDRLRWITVISFETTGKIWIVLMVFFCWLRVKFVWCICLGTLAFINNTDHIFFQTCLRISFWSTLSLLEVMLILSMLFWKITKQCSLLHVFYVYYD